MDIIAITDNDINEIIAVYSLDKFIQEANKEAMLWDRTHFTKPWKRSRILIHGHTPIQYLPGTKDWHIQSYANGHKYDLDTACWRTGILNMLCLEDESIITLLRDDNITFDF